MTVPHGGTWCTEVQRVSAWVYPGGVPGQGTPDMHDLGLLTSDMHGLGLSSASNSDLGLRQS